jgi:hypothetical protein
LAEVALTPSFSLLHRHKLSGFSHWGTNTKLTGTVEGTFFAYVAGADVDRNQTVQHQESDARLLLRVKGHQLGISGSLCVALARPVWRPVNGAHHSAAKRQTLDPSSSGQFERRLV